MSTRRLMAIIGIGATILGSLHVRTATSQGYTGVYEEDFADVISAGKAEWLMPDEEPYCDKSCGGAQKCCDGGGIYPY